MSGKVFVLFTLLLVLLVSAAASAPESSAAAEAKDGGALQRLLSRGQKSRDWTPRTRTQRRAHLSEDEKEIMTKQIMQAISEMMNSECLPDRDYQGWVDFGRRDAE